MPYFCGVCKLEIGRKRCLQCACCRNWLHIECDGVSKELFSVLDKNRNLSYTCKNCIDNPPDSVDDDEDSLKIEISQI